MASGIRAMKVLDCAELNRDGCHGLMYFDIVPTLPVTRYICSDLFQCSAPGCRYSLCSCKDRAFSATSAKLEEKKMWWGLLSCWCPQCTDEGTVRQRGRQQVCDFFVSHHSRCDPALSVFASKCVGVMSCLNGCSLRSRGSWLGGSLVSAWSFVASLTHQRGPLVCFVFVLCCFLFWAILQ